MTRHIKWPMLLGTLLISVFYTTACGSQGASEPGATARSVSSEAMPTPRKLFGDYDKDDYEPGDDADNDDSSLPKDRDNDSDNSTGSYYDSDDASALAFGHAASTVDKRTITALVKRYYAAAAARDGTAGCALIYAPLANGVAEDLGKPPGPPYFRGKTCSVVMSKVFTLNSKQLSTYAAKLNVSSVRINQNTGLVVLSFKTLPGRQLPVLREHGVWKIGALLDNELP